MRECAWDFARTFWENNIIIRVTIFIINYLAICFGHYILLRVPFCISLNNKKGGKDAYPYYISMVISL